MEQQGHTVFFFLGYQPVNYVVFCIFRKFFHCGSKTDFVCLLISEKVQAWTGFYASRNVLKGVARRASSLSYAADSLFARYQINYPDGPVQKEWAMDKLKAIRWAVSEVNNV